MRQEHALLRAETAGASVKPATSFKPALGSTVTYVNELGSTAAFTFGNNGSVSGTYTSTVSGGGGTVTGPITGWNSGDVIAWSVMWSTRTPAVTSWTGAFVQQNGTWCIDSLWYLSTQTANPGDPSQFWSAINAGSDFFTQQ